MTRSLVPRSPEEGSERASLVAAFEQASLGGDVTGMAEAALALSRGHVFGTVPGRVPAFLHEAYRAATGPLRGRLAVALARAWGYGGDFVRAEAFAREALSFAEQGADDPALLAQALDALLIVHWGPDDLDERLVLTRRLDEVAAHVTDPEVRLSAHLWRLTTALEVLDQRTVQRQLRELIDLADETGSPRIRFFAASRRGMYALLKGDLDEAAAARREAAAAGAEAAEPDADPIDRVLASGIARQVGDRRALADEARAFEAFGTTEGVLSVTAEAASLWLGAGDLGRASMLLHSLTDERFTAVPRDVDWPLTMASLVEVAVGVGAETYIRNAVRLLEPYADRGIVNGGGVGFVGVVDDFLFQALRALGRDEAAGQRQRSAADAYARLGAAPLLRRLALPADEPRRPHAVHLHPSDGGLWLIGGDGEAIPVPDARGLHYLRLLLARPNEEVSAVDLVAAVAGHPGGTMVDGDLGPSADRRALAAYRSRLRDLDDELDEARAYADDARVERLEREREALLAEVAGATGLSGRSRSAGTSAERARVAVRKAIAASLVRLGTAQPTVARLLRDTVRTGSRCSYEPDPERPVRWILSERDSASR